MSIYTPSYQQMQLPLLMKISIYVKYILYLLPVQLPQLRPSHRTRHLPLPAR